MSQSTEHAGPVAAHAHEAEITEKVLGGGSTVESIAGAGAVTLSILGLCGVIPGYMLAISVIAVGAGLVLEGATVAARAADIISRLADRTEEIDVSGGVTVEFLGGAAGIVLGILGLLAIDPLMLSAVAAVVFGGTLLLSSKGRVDLNRAVARTFAGPHTHRDELMYHAVTASASSRTLVGIGAGVLGILVLAGVTPYAVLTLIAMLCAGASLLLSGLTFTGRAFSALRH